MADKIPHRRKVPVPVYCNQPAPKLMPWEDTWAELRSFSPNREHVSPESLPPRLSLYRHQPSSQGTLTSHRMANDENIPPPSTQPRHQDSSPLFDAAAPGGSKVPIIPSTERINKLKRVLSKSPIESDNESDRVIKKQRLASNNKENLLEERVARIADGIERMAAEAREDRQEFNATFKKLLCELQRKL